SSSRTAHPGRRGSPRHARSRPPSPPVPPWPGPASASPPCPVRTACVDRPRRWTGPFRRHPVPRARNPYPCRMTDPQLVLTERVQSALAVAVGAEFADADPLIRPSQFADYQANVALSLAKRLRRQPREVAQSIADHLTDFPGTVEVSGPGFLNITLDDAWIAEQANRVFKDPRLGVGVNTPPQTVVIDYSAPNAAKEM